MPAKEFPTPSRYLRASLNDLCLNYDFQVEQGPGFVLYQANEFVEDDNLERDPSFDVDEDHVITFREEKDRVVAYREVANNGADIHWVLDTEDACLLYIGYIGVERKNRVIDNQLEIGLLERNNPALRTVKAVYNFKGDHLEIDYAAMGKNHRNAIMRPGQFRDPILKAMQRVGDSGIFAVRDTRGGGAFYPERVPSSLLEPIVNQYTIADPEKPWMGWRALLNIREFGRRGV